MDQFNNRPLTDNYDIEQFSVYDPHYNVVGYDKPFASSGLMTMQPPANTIITEWLKDGSEDASIEESDAIWREYGFQ